MRSEDERANRDPRGDLAQRLLSRRAERAKAIASKVELRKKRLGAPLPNAPSAPLPVNTTADIRTRNDSTGSINALDKSSNDWVVETMSQAKLRMRRDQLPEMRNGEGWSLTDLKTEGLNFGSNAFKRASRWLNQIPGWY